MGFGRFKASVLVVFSIFLFSASASAATYEILIRNKTPQTLTSSVCIIHGKRGSLFETGEAASEGLARLAEDGATGRFVSEMRSARGVRAVDTGNFTIANSRSRMTIESNRGRRISCALGMLVVTNDGFPAFRNLRLPRRVGQRVRFRARAYDAGSEVNTESCDHVPGGPCDAHFIGEAENGTIQLHTGIQGNGDLSAESHGWDEPAVRGRITRIE